MVTRHKFKPENIDVVEIDHNGIQGFNISYTNVFSLFFGDANFYDLIWHNQNFKIELIERLIEQTLTYIQNNPNPKHKGSK